MATLYVPLVAVSWKGSRKWHFRQIVGGKAIEISVCKLLLMDRIGGLITRRVENIPAKALCKKCLGAMLAVDEEQPDA